MDGMGRMSEDLKGVLCLMIYLCPISYDNNVLDERNGPFRTL